MRVLAVNCGSSSLKMRLIDAGACRSATLADAAVEAIGPHARITLQLAGASPVRREAAVPDWSAAFGMLLAQSGAMQAIQRKLPELQKKYQGKNPKQLQSEVMALSAEALARGGGDLSIDSVGHRVVQGGRYVASTAIDGDVIRAIEAAQAIAPLHNGPSLEGIRAAREHLPAVAGVAVFDTAFHASMPAVAAQYALPGELAGDAGIRRYGYHGLAHRSMSERYAELAGIAPDDVRVVTLQLGNGCSAAAVHGRGSIDTSMGFTPLEGLVMGTRAGDIDPAVVVYLQRERGMSPDDVDALLNHRSGLLGVSGSGSDMRDLLAAEARGDARAAAAIDLFCYRARKYIGAYIAALGGAQAVVFGGGIGERAPEVRRRIIEPLAALGIAIDPARNGALTDGEGRISTDASAIAAYVIPSDEERIIARETYGLLAR